MYLWETVSLNFCKQSLLCIHCSGWLVNPSPSISLNVSQTALLFEIKLRKKYICHPATQPPNHPHLFFPKFSASRLAASSRTCVGWGGGVGADEHRPLKPRTAWMEGKTTRWVVSSRMQHQTHAWMARQSRSCRKLVVFHTAGHPASVHHACLWCRQETGRHGGKDGQGSYVWEGRGKRVRERERQRVDESHDKMRFYVNRRNKPARRTAELLFPSIFFLLFSLSYAIF